jgi:hypothetical protein
MATSHVHPEICERVLSQIHLHPNSTSTVLQMYIKDKDVTKVLDRTLQQLLSQKKIMVSPKNNRAYICTTTKSSCTTKREGSTSNPSTCDVCNPGVYDVVFQDFKLYPGTRFTVDAMAEATHFPVLDVGQALRRLHTQDIIQAHHSLRHPTSYSLAILGAMELVAEHLLYQEDGDDTQGVATALRFENIKYVTKILSDLWNDGQITSCYDKGCIIWSVDTQDCDIHF